MRTLRTPQRGMALVLVLMTMTLVMAVGAALVMTTSSESLISWHFRGSQEALYGAEAAGEWALVDLPAVVPDWPTLLQTNVSSWFVDGVASGKRLLADGSLVDLGAVVAENASWKPYAYGPLKDLLPPPAGLSGSSPFYVVVFVAADPADPAASSRLRVRTEAFGPLGAHKMLELGVLRDAVGVHLVSWTEVR